MWGGEGKQQAQISVLIYSFSLEHNDIDVWFVAINIDAESKILNS